MPPVMNRPQVPMNRPQVPMNRPMTPMNRVASAPAATQGIGQALAAQAAARQSGMSPMGGAGGNMPQGIAAILAGMAAKNPQGPMPQVGQQLPGLPINSELRNQAYLKDLMRAAQTMSSPLQTGQLGSQPIQMGPPSDFQGQQQAQQQLDGMFGQYGPPPPSFGIQQGPQAQQNQMGMLANLSQMFNTMGQQQPAQQGGTPLQNNSSPLQQSAQPVMNPGVM